MPMHGQYGRSVANVYVNKGILVLNMLSMINVHMWLSDVLLISHDQLSMFFILCMFVCDCWFIQL